MIRLASLYTLVHLAARKRHANRHTRPFWTDSALPVPGGRTTLAMAGVLPILMSDTSDTVPLYKRHLYFGKSPLMNYNNKQTENK
jgi:hypothetical protein